MDNNSNVFEAEAMSLLKLFRIEGNVAGFRIPTYQRRYDWGEKNIKRLFEDIMAGLYWSSKDKSSLTFIGTVIVLEEDNKENNFDGRSLSIIDGQQRLTTISLIATQLYIEHSKAIKRLEKQRDLPKHIKSWINSESIYSKQQLISLIFGTLPSFDNDNYPFPRIVREDDDVRSSIEKEVKYDSIISRFLLEARNNLKKADQFEFSFPDSNAGMKFKQNLVYIQKCIDSFFNDREVIYDNLYSNLIEPRSIDNEGILKLFKKLPKEKTDENKIIDYCTNPSVQILEPLRLVCFTNFLLSQVIVTLVKVKHEKYGFDIFDSLNTTGEPLTAIQTFKPQVIRFENLEKKYYGSNSEDEMRAIENYIENNFQDTIKKQKAAKELVVSFALYKSGEKVSLNLSDQRKYMQNSFNKIIDAKRKRLFIKNLNEVASYRENYWIANHLDVQLSRYPERPLILLCLQLLKEMKTSLTIPILCRFYQISVKKKDKRIFTDAVKSLTAFVILRRSATPNTAGIDNDFRGLMLIGKKKGKCTPLCLGITKTNSDLSIDDFKEYLTDWLKHKDIENKQTWLNKVISQPLYSISAPLCKILILLAAHNSRQEKKDSFNLKKGRKTAERNYLTLDAWGRVENSTVEHIVPQSSKAGSWSRKIYSQPSSIHKLGNLTLLPVAENSIAGNKSWKIKRKLFEAFSCEKKDDIDKVIAEAKKNGFNFKKQTLLTLKETGAHLPLVKSICTIDKWSLEIIEERTENLASLAWDELESWLFK